MSQEKLEKLQQIEDLKELCYQLVTELNGQQELVRFGEDTDMSGAFSLADDLVLGTEALMAGDAEVDMCGWEGQDCGGCCCGDTEEETEQETGSLEELHRQGRTMAKDMYDTVYGDRSGMKEESDEAELVEEPETKATCCGKPCC